MSHPKKEQRAHPRHKVTLPVLVRDATQQVGATIEFDTHDVSLGGAFIRSDFLFEVGEVLQVKLQIKQKILQARVTVVRVVRETDEGTAGMGVRFELTEKDAHVLSDYLKHA